MFRIDVYLDRILMPCVSNYFYLCHSCYIPTLIIEAFNCLPLNLFSTNLMNQNHASFDQPCDQQHRKCCVKLNPNSAGAKSCPCALVFVHTLEGHGQRVLAGGTPVSTHSPCYSRPTRVSYAPYDSLRLVERNRKESAYAGIIEQCLCRILVSELLSSRSSHFSNGLSWPGLLVCR